MTKEELIALKDIVEFVKAFVDYRINEPSLESGELTDAQILASKLPIIERLLTEPTENVVDYHIEDSLLKDSIENNKEFKNYIYSQIKHARESVNPNYKYCVVDASSLHECWLTDSLHDAMEKANYLSVNNSHMTYVLSIFKAKDGTYRTKIEFYSTNGELLEPSGYSGDYLHFDYIAQIAKIKKI